MSAPVEGCWVVRPT